MVKIWLKVKWNAMQIQGAVLGKLD